MHLRPRRRASPQPIDIWLINNDRLSVGLNDALVDLSSTEKSRVDSMSRPALRRSRALSRWAVRQILAKYLNVRPREIELVTNRYGKPQLRGSPIHMNISHSGEFTVIAVSDCTPVGVDLELDRAVPDCRNLAAWMMSTGEQKTFSSFAEQHHRRRFLELWTRKEAILKCQGTGLTMDPRSVNIGWNGWTVQVDGETLMIAEIDLGPNLICTLCSARDFHVNFCEADLPQWQ